jgi:hypothetical protein
MWQVITMCQDIADSLDVEFDIDAIIIDSSKAFDVLVIPPCSAAYEPGVLRRYFEGIRLGKGIPCRSYTEDHSRRETVQGSQSNLRCAARERFGPTTVSSVRNICSSIRLFANDCITYKKITNKIDIEEL